MNAAGTAIRPVRVMVIDDDTEFLELVRVLLEGKEGNIRLVGRFISPNEALRQVVKLDPDVALVDIKMPDMDGITCARRIKELRPGTAVLIVSGAGAALYCQSAILSGACGFLTKPFEREEIEQAILSAAKGLSVFTDSGIEALCQQTKAARADLIRTRGLNEREVAALDLLARFLENKEIADQLSISIPLAQKILLTAFAKLGVHGRAEAIVLWDSSELLRRRATPRPQRAASGPS